MSYEIVLKSQTKDLYAFYNDRFIYLSLFVFLLIHLFILIYEPRHEISNNLVCETSKASDQPAHMSSLIRAFAGRLNIL